MNFLEPNRPNITYGLKQDQTEIIRLIWFGSQEPKFHKKDVLNYQIKTKNMHSFYDTRIINKSLKSQAASKIYKF